VRDAVRDGTGLAGARPGEHPDRTAQRGRDGTLLGVKTVEQAVGVGHGTSSFGRGSAPMVLRAADSRGPRAE
jgi:hypothetical protein